MLTQNQIEEAVEQMRSHCKHQEETGDWSVISSRGILYSLGYEEVEAILDFLYESGFRYCLDAKYPAYDGSRISSSVTYWSPDQLRSRLPRTAFGNYRG